MKKIILQMLLVIASIGFAQAQTKITGTITDATNGEPLPYATVSVKGIATSGQLTDNDGNYSITLPAGSKFLVISYMGYTTQEVEVGQRSVIKVALAAEALRIEEAVAVGYLTVKKGTFTGAASVVKSEKLEQLPVASLNQALQGQVSGMQATTGSGQPGAETKIIIRGIGSLNAGIDPLYIVDGVPIITGNLTGLQGANGSLSTAMSGLNPNDIASVNVLKDASATSIYGARAANGVVLITTKKGRQGKTIFNFSSQAGLSSRTSTNFRMVNRDEWIELAKESYLNSGLSEAEFDSYMKAFPKKSDGTFYDTDWIDEAYRSNALTYQTNFSAQGGDEKTNFFFSIGRYSQDAIANWGNITRTSGRLSINHKATKWLTIGANSAYAHSFEDIPLSTSAYYVNPISGSLNVSPLEPVYNEDGTYRQVMIANSGTNFVEANNYNIFEYRTHRLTNSAFAEITFIDNLKFKTLYGSDISIVRNDDWHDPRTTGTSAKDLGRASRSMDETNTWNLTNTLTYSFDLNEKHFFNLLAGQENSENYGVWIGGTTEGFPGFTIKEPSVGAKPTNVSASQYKSRLLSYFGQLNYNYLSKYYLTGSIRRDGSSKFGANHKFATFWSLGLSWKMKSEDFMKSFDWLDDLTVRSSYGTSGNSSIGSYASKGLYSFGKYNGGNTTYPSQLGSDDLAWESQASFNFGVDFKVLQSRIGGSVEVYHRKTSNMLLSVPISYATGFSSQLRNVGAMQNKGIEVSIFAEPIRTKDFSWTIDANWSRNLNKVLKLNKIDPKDEKGAAFDNPINGRCWIEEGADLMQYKLVKYAGVNPADGAQMWYTKDGELSFTRDYGSMATTGIGSASPKGQGGITNTLRYKGFSVSAFFYFQYGNKVFDNVAYQYMDDGNMLTSGVVATQLDRWQKPGDITSVPKRLMTNSTQVSTRYLFDGSFIRLRNLNVAYSLPESLTKKIGVSNFKIFVQGQNLLTITKYPGQDPEVPWTGTAFYAYPACKTWTVGVDIKF